MGGGKIIGGGEEDNDDAIDYEDNVVAEHESYNRKPTTLSEGAKALEAEENPSSLEKDGSDNFNKQEMSSLHSSFKLGTTTSTSDNNGEKQKKPPPEVLKKGV